MEAWMSGKKNSCEEHPKVHQLASTVIAHGGTSAARMQRIYLFPG
jgi:hypothetical protein